MSFDVKGMHTIQPHNVDLARPWLVPYLDEFARKTCLVSAEDVLTQAKNGDCQLWSYFDGEQYRGVVATRIHHTTIGHICSLWVCIGVDATELMDGVYREIENWARGIGCYAMEIVGREGWERRLPGFTRKAVVLEKRLQETH